MPVAGGGGVGGNRQTFRPPWVREGPPPIPMPSQPWVKSTRSQAPPADAKEAAGVVSSALRKASDGRKSSTVTIIPTQPKDEKTPEPVPKPSTASRKISEPTPKQATTEPSRKVSEPAKPTAKVAEKLPPKAIEKVSAKPVEKPVEKKINIAVEKPPEKSPDSAAPLERTSSRNRGLERSRTTDKYEGLAVPPKPPAPPPMPPPPPPLPNTKEMLPEKPKLTDVQEQRIEALRSRPKRRPDWANMMKEIETARKLSHVVTNDRSAPLLPRVKAKGQFVYESERPNLHNQLLKQIAGGIQLKSVKTNDRSKPFIEGLRKFRRQMTIEEQIQKSTSMATMGIQEVEPDPLDEVDDIDKVRDDLQSTKQLLAMELKNKEALERENKKLLTRILNLEVELQKEKNRVNLDTPQDRQEMKQEMEQMGKELGKSRQLADEMETKYQDTAAKLDLVKLDLDEAVQKSLRLEKQLRVAQAANLAHTGQVLAKQPSAKKIINQNKSTNSISGNVAADDEETEDESEEESEDETEEESDEADGQDEQAATERRQARELKLLQTKLKSLKDKRMNAQKERKALKEQTAKLQKSVKTEKAKYKILQKEVDKMSKLMIEGEDDEEEEEEEEEETETESESEESEDSESEESEGDIPESEPPEKRKANFQTRVKRHENLVSSLKKGNYLLKANVDRFKDELNKQKEMALTLQEDLNSVLAELG